MSGARRPGARSREAGGARAAADAGSAVVAIIAPEPVPWLASVVRAAEAVGTASAVRVFAPWALGRAETLARLPGALGGFASRRRVSLSSRAAASRAPAEGAAPRVSSIPGWAALELGMRAWSRGRADRELRARFAVRRAVDALAARWLAGLSPPPRVVVAPSCAARRAFAVAAGLGAATVLIEDVPDIRGLHADLDAAARVHPECVFLRRFRAPRPIVVRQEAERALAELLVVRGVFARERARASHGAARVVDVPTEPAGAPDSGPPAAAAAPGGARILLAGLAAARHGTVEALVAIAERPHVSLWVRPGDGMEPADLLAHPRVQAVDRAGALAMARGGAEMVLAPAWCESYLPEVEAAAAAGVPVVATARGAGFVAPAVRIPRGDAAALGRGIDEVLGCGPGVASSASVRDPDSLSRALAAVIAADAATAMAATAAAGAGVQAVRDPRASGRVTPATSRTPTRPESRR